jgi:hypothetical protein
VVLTVVFLQDLATKIDEGFVDVDTSPGRCFVVGFGTPLLSELKGSASGDDSVFFHVTLVADHYHWDIVVFFDANDLLSEIGELVEGVQVGNREDEQEAISLFHVEFAHGGELVCACRVKSSEVR